MDVNGATFLSMNGVLFFLLCSLSNNSVSIINAWTAANTPHGPP